MFLKLKFDQKTLSFIFNLFTVNIHSFYLRIEDFKILILSPFSFLLVLLLFCIIEKRDLNMVAYLSNFGCQMTYFHFRLILFCSKQSSVLVTLPDNVEKSISALSAKVTPQDCWILLHGLTEVLIS